MLADKGNPSARQFSATPELPHSALSLPLPPSKDTVNAREHGKAIPAVPLVVGWGAARQGPNLPRVQHPTPHCPPLFVMPTQHTEALRVFIGISGAQLCRFNSSCASCSAAGMEGGWQPLGALSPLSPYLFPTPQLLPTLPSTIASP